MKWKKIFTNDKTHKRLISKLYKQSIQLNTHTHTHTHTQPHNQKTGRRPKETFLHRRHTDG